MDPYWANVVSLLNMGGANGSTTFTDSTGLRTWTQSGDAQISSALGVNAAAFSGSGGFVQTPYVTSEFDWWTSDYTIEAWIYAGSLANWHVLSGSVRVPCMAGNMATTGSLNFWSFGPINGNVLRFFYYNGASVTSATTVGVVPTNAFVHLAMSKNATGIYLSINGTVEGPFSVSGTPQSSSGTPFVLGQHLNREIVGYVQALRVTGGVARYTSSFSPPSAPFPTA